MPLNACRRLPLTDIEREGSSPPILVTSVTSAILAEIGIAVARTHTERHPAGVKTEVLYLILMLSIILISLSYFSFTATDNKKLVQVPKLVHKIIQNNF